MPPKYQHRLIIVLATSVAFLFITVLALIYINYYPKDKVITANIPTPTTIPASDWQTYTNSKYGFSFQYPSTWQEEPTSDSPPENILRMSTVNKCRRFNLYVYPPTPNLNNYLTEYYGGNYQQMLDQNQIKIADEPTIVIGSQGIGEVRTVYVNRKSNLFVINEFANVPEGGDDGYWQRECENFNPNTDQILATVKFTESTSLIPKPISDFYNTINQEFNLNLVPTEENEFYSNTGMFPKKSWKIDFVDTSLGKKFSTFIRSILSRNNLGGAMGGAAIDGYENDQIICIHSYGNASGGPENYSNPYNYLLCTTK